jgi:hypothetical protein
MSKVRLVMTDLQRRIAYYVSRLDDDSAARHEMNGYTGPADTHRADYISDKWCRVVRISYSGNGYSDEPRVSVHTFVALMDNHTKTLGVIKAGNIHKAHGWKAPARTLRGNLISFDPPPDFAATSVVIGKPKRRERTRLLASTIRNEIVTQIGIPKVRLRVRWDGRDLFIHVIDTTKEEVALVRTYAVQHKERFGIGRYHSDQDNQVYDCVYVYEDGEHEDGVPDTHEAIKILDSLR